MSKGWHPSKLLSFGAKVTDSHMKIIGQCSKIQHLYLDIADISDESVGYINELKNLEMLDLSYCKISVKFLNEIDLKSLNKLKSLTISRTILEGDFNISKFKNLENFVLADCSLSTSFKEKLVAELPNIKFDF